MPRVAQYQAANLNGWPDGLNLEADSSRLEATELADAMNVRLGSRGELGIRSGYTRFDNVSMTHEPLFLYPWRTQEGADFLIAVDTTGDIWYGSSVTFTNSTKSLGVGSTIQDWGAGFAGAKGKMYVSGKNAPNVVSFDGSSWADVATIPKAKHLWYRHGRLFAINDDARTSGVYFSELLEPELFAVDDYLEIDPEDGYEINAAEVFGDDLILFKDKAIHKLSGRSPSSFSLYKIDSHRGTVSPQSIAQLRGRMFFYDRDTGVWAFDGATFELASEPINDYMLDGQDYDKAFEASIYAGDDRLYVSIPWAAGGRRTFTLNGDTGSWVEYDSGYTGRVYYLDQRFLSFPGQAGIWYADPDSSSVPGQSGDIEMTARTGWFIIAGPGALERIRRLEFTFKGGLWVSGIINMYADFNEETPYASRSFLGGPAPSQAALKTDERRVAIDGWGGRVRAVQFEFITDDRPFQINEMTIFYTGQVDLRGQQ